MESKPDKPRFTGKSRRPDRMAEERGERRPYTGGGNRFEREGAERPPRPGKRPYGGTPRYSRDDKARLPAEFQDPPRESAERSERPAFGDRPFKKPPFRKEGFKKEGFKTGGFKKEGFKPAFKKDGFKKKFTGKAAGAKGSYKGGKAFRDKSR